MLTSRNIITISLLSCAMLACKGDTGATGPQGDQGSAGPPGQNAPNTGTITGTITDGIAGDPLAGVAVTAADEGGSPLATATTGADGAFSVSVTAGPVELSFAKSLYTAPGLLQSGVGAGQTIHLAVTMNEAASGKPSILLAGGPDDAGYGSQLLLTATASDPNDTQFTYAWKNTTVPALGDVSNSGAPCTDGTCTLTFPTMTDAFAARLDSANNMPISGYVIEDRFGIVPISTDQRGQVSASVTVSDGRGQSATASITLNAASVTNGIANVPINQRIYLNSGHTGTNNWQVISLPPGSAAAFDDPTARTPAFTPEVAGAYTLNEGTNNITIYASTYYGVITGSTGDVASVDNTCLLCHQQLNASWIPDKFTPWLGTHHATAFTNGVNGVYGSHFSGSCDGCHTVGFDSGVASNGFDDAQSAAGWSFPSSLVTTNWQTMVQSAPEVAKLANVQCESCHGPQGGAIVEQSYSAAHMLTAVNQQSLPFQSPRISYAAEACAPCHGAGADHIYTEWAMPDGNTANRFALGHSSRTVMARAISSKTGGLDPSCGRCHSAQGYSLYAGLLAQGKVTMDSVPTSMLALVSSANVQAVTCVACHDPHDATNPNQLRFFGNLANTPGGFGVAGMGKGAVCISCHNSRNGALSDISTYLHEDGQQNPVDYSAPHVSAQGDMLMGRNAYFIGPNALMTSKHAAVQDTCVGCHMKLNPTMYISRGTPAHAEHSFAIEDSQLQTLCANCHGSSVDGAGIQAQVVADLTTLANKMGNSIVARAANPNGLTVLAYDDATTGTTKGDYSAADGKTPNVQIPGGNVVSASLVSVHGATAFHLKLSVPVNVQFYDSKGNKVDGVKAMTEFAVPLAGFVDTVTSLPAFSLSGNLVRAAWNYMLVNNDGSKGLHNPSFVNAVLSATMAKDLTY